MCVCLCASLWFSASLCVSVLHIIRAARERPEMLIDEHGNPTHLITGVVDATSVPGTMNDRSWTLVQPVLRR